MKRKRPLLLVVLMCLGILVYASAAYAQSSDAYNLAAFDDIETQTALESSEPGNTPRTEETPAVTDDDTVSPETDFSMMTPQQLYEYLLTLETDEEIDAFLSALTPEQYAALEAFRLSVTETALKDVKQDAINYTQAAPLKDPIEVSPRIPEKMAMQAMNASAHGEDGLVLSKTVSGNLADGYKLTIEAYATGEVHITTTQKPIPADIILVLDLSLSMDGGMISGYSPITYSTNIEAYNNSSGLFVKVNGQYYSVSITKSGNEFTYRYTGASGQVTATSDKNNGKPPDWSFYKTASTVSRIAALKTAANSFIDSIETQANTEDGVDHRIAVVTYSTNASIISGNTNTSGAFVKAHNNTSGINSLQTAINGLSTIGYTRSDLGLQKAADIFQNNPPDTSGLRSRIVVFFTDGAPASSGDGSFQASVANPAIEYAKTLKAAPSASGYGATVYAIGIFDGANPSTPLSSASNENKFMHFVSSNYPNAISMTNYGTGSNAGYYLSASNTAGLSSIFQSISENIEAGGANVELDENSVIRDIIAPYFRLPTGTAVSDIRLYTSSADIATGSWLPRVAFSGNTTISPDGTTIGVSGFDYAENYYAAIETNGTVTGYKGKKLVIEIPVEYISGSCFGGTVPTNKPISGIYTGDDLVKALPIPTVDIPANYNFTPVNQSIYLSQNAMLDGMFTPAAGYAADGINNAYVDIVYTVRSGGGTVLGTYTIKAGDDQADGKWDISHFALEGLTANTNYTVDCTVTPVSGPVVPLSLSKPVTVHVFTPEVVWLDSVIWLGETANFDNNRASVAWKNTAAGTLLPAGIPPVLLWQYTPAASAFDQDTHVRVAVRVGGTDVTSYTRFVHDDCGFPGCAYNPALGQFMVHVKACSLTITKQGAADTTDTFIFKVTGGGLTLYVSVQGNGSQTIVGLPVGNYTITEQAAWSWRYTAGGSDVILNASYPSAAVTVGNTQTNDKWLGGDSHAVNTFPNAG